jgi:hypothetical protein
VYDEILYTVLFTNPANCASAWPGGMAPPSPVSIPQMNPLLRELDQDMRNPEYSLFRQSLAEGVIGDRLSWTTLRKSGFSPCESTLPLRIARLINSLLAVVQSPLEYLSVYRPTTIKVSISGGTRRRTAFCHGPDIPFTICCSTKKEKMFKLTSTLNFVHYEKRANNTTPTIWIRPGGTDVLENETFGPNTLYFIYMSKNLDLYKSHIGDDSLIRMSVGQIPGTHADHPAFGMYVDGINPRVWLIDQVKAPMVLQLPPEAKNILRGIAPRPVDLVDLAVVQTLKQGMSYATSTRRRDKGKRKAVNIVPTLPRPTQELVAEWSTVGHSSNPCFMFILLSSVLQSSFLSK